MRICIFGAGQAGRMLNIWCSYKVTVLGYMDNNKELQGKTVDGINVFSAESGLEMNPEEIWIAVLNHEAEEKIINQLKEAGFNGVVRRISETREIWDFRLAVLRLYAREIDRRCIQGAVAELGTYQGDFAAELRKVFPKRKLYLFDTFQGFDEKDIKAEKEKHSTRAKEGDFSDTSVGKVMKKLGNTENVIVRKGYFPDTAKGIEEIFAFVNIDPDLYKPTLEGLKYFYPRMTAGGCIFVHDYNSSQFKGVHDAVMEFCEDNHVYLTPLTDLHGTAIIIKNN